MIKNDIKNENLKMKFFLCSKSFNASYLKKIHLMMVYF
jgi:hypothetical protein